MTVLLGNFALSLSVLAALLAVLLAIAAVRFDSASLLATSKRLMVGLFGLVTLASVALLVALVQSDMGLAYVARYTERAMPTGYKLAAFWAGQEGSLLLWAWLLAGMSAIAVFQVGSKQSSTKQSSAVIEPATVVATLAIVCGFFAALMVFAANPFVVLDSAPADGHGLNPMLQDPGMIAHPPTLFVGYAGYTIPFAFLVAALVVGRTDNQWIAASRRWILASWLFLSIGIILGAQWAYVELGWGGYWAWDPVENASLLPWLTGTALLHSIMVQQQRGMFKRWNAWLIAATFILCIFGTYLTRSGVIDSVHSFGKSLIGTFFLVFLAITILFSIALIVVRRGLLRPEHEMETFFGREGFFMATNVLLVAMTLLTLIGTTMPILSSMVTGRQVTVQPSFYNYRVAPLGLVLAGLMAAGPLLAWGKSAGDRLLRRLIVPAIVTVVAVVALVVGGLRSAWVLPAAAIGAAAAAVILQDLVITLVTRIRSYGENPFTALVQMISYNHRRYGAQTAHIGVAMIVIGITSSSLFEQKSIFELRPGDKAEFAGRTLVLTDVKQVRDVNFSALQATLTLNTPGQTPTVLTPQIRQYNKWEEQLNTEVSIQSTWREDVYVTLAASDGRGGVTVQAIVNPLVSWIWVGGVLMSLGTIVALLPRLRRSVVPVSQEKRARAKGRQPVVQLSA